MQHELFQHKLKVSPQPGISEPRLWVRRLVVWSDLEKEPIRDIVLRPGINIIWTPDKQGIGHGGGKTMFCRFMRYCLGENTYAPEDQRDSIASAFLNAYVGAEVILDGVCWAVLRPLSGRRGHFAIPNGSLNRLVNGELSPTGIEPFLDALEQTLIEPKAAELVPGRKQENLAWQVALAFLTRDQECRFNHVLDWRASQSDSDSPARGLNQTEKLEALRIFLKAMNPQEQLIRQNVAEFDAYKNQQQQDVSFLDWEIKKLRKSLLLALNVSDDELTQGSLGVTVLRDIAKQELAKVTGMVGSKPIDIHTARAKFEAARAKLVKLEKKLEKVDTSITHIPKLIAQLEGEYPASMMALEEAESFPCPICEVPVDRVLAVGCQLSHKLPDLEACKARLQKNREDVKKEKENLRALKAESKELKVGISLAQQETGEAKKLYEKLGEIRSSQEEKLYKAKRLLDEVERLDNLWQQLRKAENSVKNNTDGIEDMRQQLANFINQQTNVLTDLNEKFDGVIRTLIQQNASGEIRLTGKGLQLKVQMGGNRSTSAIDSLKVVAFDLAVLCLSIEGKTNLPAFLLHDSPREADLGLQLYDRLFHLVHCLEGINITPTFQYIITTTTRPPSSLAKKPWLVETFAGSPDSERFLRQNL